LGIAGVPPKVWERVGGFFAGAANHRQGRGFTLNPSSDMPYPSRQSALIGMATRLSPKGSNSDPE
jgi:hypothetical protein